MALLSTAVAVLGLAGPAQETRAEDRVFPNAPHPTRLLVVAPAAFAPALAPFVAHKNATRMPTCLLTLETVRKELPGRDDAERLKRGIALAHERMGVQFVFLVGDASLVPVRFHQVQQMAATAPHDGTYNPSELYYANLYHDHVAGADARDPRAIRHGGRFDTWDEDGDGIYNERHWHDDAAAYNPDHVDGCPDIALGRLPARTAEEAGRYVARVLEYETGKLDPAMFRRSVFVADGWCPAGQALCDAVAAHAPESSFLRGTTVIRLLLDPMVTPLPAPWSGSRLAELDQTASGGWLLTYVGVRVLPLCNQASDLPAGQDGDDSPRGRTRPIAFTVGGGHGTCTDYQPSSRYRDQRGVLHEFAWHGAEGGWEDRVSGVHLGSRLTVPQPDPYELPGRTDGSCASRWLLGSGAGGIAYFGENVVCDLDLGPALLRAMLERGRTAERVLGELWLQGQRGYWLDHRADQGVFRHPRAYLGILQLFGDPSLRLPASLGGQ